MGEKHAFHLVSNQTSSVCLRHFKDQFCQDSHQKERKNENWRDEIWSAYGPRRKVCSQRRVASPPLCTQKVNIETFLGILVGGARILTYHRWEWKAKILNSTHRKSRNVGNRSQSLPFSRKKVEVDTAMERTKGPPLFSQTAAVSVWVKNVWLKVRRKCKGSDSHPPFTSPRVPLPFGCSEWMLSNKINESELSPWVLWAIKANTPPERRSPPEPWFIANGWEA